MLQPGSYGIGNQTPNFELNPSDRIMTADPYAGRKPEYYVGIFNVSKREIKVARPWAINGLVKISAREDDQLFSKPFILRDVEDIRKIAAGSDEIVLIPTKGEFLAQDVVNTNDSHGNWQSYRPLNAATASSEGNNYYEMGVFWVRLATPDSEPDMEAVETAITRMEARYQRLLTEANQYYSGGSKSQAFICDPHHEAADYFISSGVELNLPWHQVITGNLIGKLRAKNAAAASAAAKTHASK